MRHFDYRGDELYCEDVPLRAIADAVGTPTYVYSHATLERHLRVFDEAFAGLEHLVCYSVKACSNLAVLRTLFRGGAGADIVSAGELHRALRAGCDPSRIVFSGVGKREDEIAAALESGILALNVESHEELLAVERVAADLDLVAPVSLRVNPDVDAETHPYIATGLRESKFGIPAAEAPAAFRFARGLRHVALCGIDCHIGSQLTKTSPFRDAVSRIAGLARELLAEGVPLRLLDVGGGLGIQYQGDASTPPTPADYARAVVDSIVPAFAGMGLTLVTEPGRVLVGNAGVLLARVLYRKPGEARSFTIVDAAMNDLIRPAFYDAYHEILPALRRPGAVPWVSDVVGPICESGDFLARARALPRPEPGDVLAVMSAGAYGFAMASNYNSRPRAAEVMVHGDRFAIVRRREELADLVRGEDLPPWLG